MSQFNSLTLFSFRKANPYLSQSLEASQGDGDRTAAALWVLGLLTCLQKLDSGNPAHQPTSLYKIGCLQGFQSRGKMNSLVGRVMCNLDFPATRQSFPHGVRREEKQLGSLQFQKSTYLSSYTRKKSNKDFKHSFLQAKQKRKNVLCSNIAYKAFLSQSSPPHGHLKEYKGDRN